MRSAEGGQRAGGLRWLPALLVLVLTPLFAWLNVGGADFDRQFYQAAQGWPLIYEAVPLTPLQTGGLFGIFLPWAIAPLQPLALLPLPWARALVQAATLAALLLLAGPRPLARAATLGSAPALLLIFHYVNLDALAALGLLLPPAGGLFLLAIKPQVAALGALVWLAEGRWRAFLPFGIVLLLATWLWPEWLGRAQASPAGALNLSLFPASLLLALPLLALALRRRDPLLAALATPLAAPYLAFYSVAPLVALLARRCWWWGLAASLASWPLLFLLMERLAALRGEG